MGRPSLAPGRYFRLLLVGYFEGIDSERGIAWRAMDSLAVRCFLRLALHEPPPDHSTIARTRRLIDLETHRAVFTWVQQRLVEAGQLTNRAGERDCALVRRTRELPGASSRRRRPGSTPTRQAATGSEASQTTASERGRTRQECKAGGQPGHPGAPS